MIEPGDLFPRALGRPITVKEAWKRLQFECDAPEFSIRYKMYWNKSKPGQSVGKLQSVKKLNLISISPTLTKNEGYGGVYHPFECRPINTGERKRLGSFPDNFIFQDWQAATEKIGNSVPPMFMKAIATQIRYKMWGGGG